MNVALIPARGGSKSIPHKNIADLGGQPMISYTINTAKLARGIDRIIVSTDDPKIKEASEYYGAEVPFIRPAEYADDNACDYDVVNHLINWFMNHENGVPENLIYLRPDFPFRKSRTLDQAIDQYSADQYSDGLRSIHISTEIPYKKWLIENDYLGDVVRYRDIKMAHNQARQLFPQTYYPNGYIDIFQSETVMKTKTLQGSKMTPFIIPEKWGNSGIGGQAELEASQSIINNFDFC